MLLRYCIKCYTDTALSVTQLTLHTLRPGFQFDTVLMNPPFGTKSNEGIDMRFLAAGLAAVVPGGAVYSFHKSTTRDYILNKFSSLSVQVLAEMKFRIPKMYRQHKKREVLVDVDFIRISGKSSVKGS